MTPCTDFTSVLQRHPALARRTAHAHFDFEVRRAGARFHLRVRPGVVEAPAAGTGDVDFTIEAGAEAWAEFARALPRAGYHDVFALVESHHARIEGRDLLPFFRHQFLVKALLAVLFTGEPRP